MEHWLTVAIREIERENRAIIALWRKEFDLPIETAIATTEACQ